MIVTISACEFEQQRRRIRDDVGLEAQVAIGACADAYALLRKHFGVALRADFDVNH